ncbi:DUF6707 family protein [Capnocytophaga sp.]|uniref:DUF6707 family protein n=1 Tax=Capnocytophaga sp. TaxID=44737 RepID=UPI0026DBE05F|nr:DUF6707 family protein [Capnocytophaga sp.]MDO5106090.1 hypothetical protein [Capnocytophaga sp.]
MNIPFEKIAPFCTTKRQQKYLEKLQKKFALTNAASRETLSDLLDSLLLDQKYEPLLALLPELLGVAFAENFDIWGDVESYLSVCATIPSLDNQHRTAIFERLKSVTQYKSTKKAQEALDYYLHRILTMDRLTDYENQIREALDDEDVAYEYAMRLGRLKKAVLMNLVSFFVDFKSLNYPSWLEIPDFETTADLQNYLAAVITHEQNALNEKRLLKYR